MNEIKRFFGKNLKRIRVAHGYTQEKLSESIGINQRQLTRIETGRSFPSFSTLDNLCNVLDVSASELFDFSQYSKVEAHADDIVQYCVNEIDGKIVYCGPNLSKCKSSYKVNEVDEIGDNQFLYDETNIFKQAKIIQKPITVEYLLDGKFLKKVTYNPDATSVIEIQTFDNAKMLNEIIHSLGYLKNSAAKLKYINLAIKCLEDKKAIEKMQNILEGMLL